MATKEVESYDSLSYDNHRTKSLPFEGRWAAVKRAGGVAFFGKVHPSVTFGDSSPQGEPLRR
jgi:hypothetical protein